MTWLKKKNAFRWDWKIFESYLKKTISIRDTFVRKARRTFIMGYCLESWT